MARIKVTEKDLSWYTRQGAGPMIVYVPGVSSNGPSDRPVLCNSIAQFERVFGSPLTSNGLSRTYCIAESFLRAGAGVLFHRFVGDSASYAEVEIVPGQLVLRSKYAGPFLNDYKVSVSSGTGVLSFDLRTPTGGLAERLVVNFVDPTSDKYFSSDVSSFVDVVVLEDVDPATITIADGLSNLSFTTKGNVGISSDEDVINAILKEGALDVLKDPYLFDFDVITSAGFTKTLGSTDENTKVFSIDPIDRAFADVAMSRGTSLYLVDGTADATLEEFYNYCSHFDTSYCAGIGPWSYAKFLSTGVASLLPGSYTMLLQWILSTSEGVPIWMAPAGVKRASLGSFFVKPKYEIGKSVLDAWQNDDEEDALDSYKVNPIMRAKSYGYVVYGNSTLLHTSGDGKTSMLQSISTRVASNIIKKEAFNISLGLQFDQMVGDLYAQFRTLMGAVLDRMKYTGAIYDYRIVLDDTTVTVGNLNERKVPVIIQISPAPAVENFDITLEITKAGVNFTDDGTTMTVEEGQ